MLWLVPLPCHYESEMFAWTTVSFLLFSSFSFVLVFFTPMDIVREWYGCHQKAAATRGTHIHKMTAEVGMTSCKTFISQKANWAWEGRVIICAENTELIWTLSFLLQQMASCPLWGDNSLFLPLPGKFHFTEWFNISQTPPDLLYCCSITEVFRGKHC